MTDLLGGAGAGAGVLCNIEALIAPERIRLKRASSLPRWKASFTIASC